MTVDKNGNLGGQQPPPWEPEVTPEVTDLEPEDDGALGSPWNRRTFLKAAALGTAAAALWQKGPGFNLGPAAAYADDLSGLNCTANDVRIVGPGIILNEPCSCSGTFNAQVQFHVINNTGTNRYCVTTHFCAGRNAAGQIIVPAQDVVFGDIPANFDGNVTVNIPNYPCNSGLVCFGAAGSGEDGGFAKGEDCPAGQCCTTITWNVKASDPCPDTTRQISSKCRHQQVCIQGFGITAACADASCNTRNLTNGCCSVGCGQSLRVKLTSVGQSGTPCANPPTFSVKRPGESSFTNVTLSGGCYVDTSPVQGTYTFRATDCHNCFREATLAVCVESLTAPVITASAPDCSGNVTVSFTSGCPQTGVTFTLQSASSCASTTWTDVGTITNCSRSIQLTQGATTALRVKASNGTAACDVFSNCIPVAVPAALSIAAPVRADNPCNGAVTFNPGTVSGGTGPFSYEFKLGSGSFVSGSSFTYNPALVSNALDTACKSLVVRVTDANGCTATSPATTFSQCISTTTGCTP
jgi:hypothetical protein